MSRFASTSLALIPVLLYPPLLFTYQIPPWLRIALFVALIVYLFMHTKRFQQIDLLSCSLVAILSVSMLFTNLDSLDGLRTVGNVVLTLVFAYALSRAARINDRFKRNLIKAYKILFILIPVSSLVSVLFFAIFGDLNLYHLNYSEESNFQNTPFGLLLYKDTFGFGLYRSFFFFSEPVFVALFYAVNAFWVAPYMGRQSSIFYYANIAAGLLTFSYLFFVGSAVLLVSRNATLTLSRGNIWRLLIVLCLIMIALILDWFAASSLTERTYRMNLFLEAMNHSSVVQIMFGQGFFTDTGFDRGFSAGFLTTIYQIGVVNLIAIMVLAYFWAGGNWRIFLVFLLGNLVYEPIKFPLFWVMIIVLSALLPDTHRVQATSKGPRSLLRPIESAGV